MTNADIFKMIFGKYATEVWAMPEKEFLEWLNSDDSYERFEAFYMAHYRQGRMDEAAIREGRLMMAFSPD